ncbi:RluA family pseudouridine synthase [Aerococcaceae bacterium DSM 111020]|nr:RluA family pseudouridine synthase [Aerococcaceae bacterium DSM 111020]
MKQETIELKLDGQQGRLDKVLSIELTDYSRTQIQQLIKEEKVLVDQKIEKANYKLNGTERIEITIPEPEVTTIEAENIPLDIVYEDDDVLVINKAAGIVVHPSKGHRNGTIVNGLVHYLGSNLSDRESMVRPGIVHRIDKDTSGLMIVAKNDFTHQALSEQLMDRSLGRTYLAIVNGPIEIPQGIIEVPIGRDIHHRTRFSVTESGKAAYTIYEVIENYKQAALVKAELKTGRTHQIRVHFEYIGHPIVGDPIYRTGLAEMRGSIVKESSGQYLHASELHFIHPRTHEEISLNAPMPPKFIDLINRLEKIE